MSIFNDFLTKLNEISNSYTNNFNDDLKVVFECFDSFEEEFQKGKSERREKVQKGTSAMTHLQSIHEDEDEPNNKRSDKSDQSSTSGSSDSRASKKRSKNEVEGILSPKQDKRLKRKASVKALTMINKQANVNLTQKLRREKSTDSSSSQTKGLRYNEDNKENTEPNETVPVVQIKQEKISQPPEPMNTDSLPVDIEVKQLRGNRKTDEIAMPPPAAPIPKPRQGPPKNKSNESKTSNEASSTKRWTTRNKKQTELVPPPPSPPPREPRQVAPKTKSNESRTSDEASSTKRRTTRNKKQTELVPPPPSPPPREPRQVAPKTKSNESRTSDEASSTKRRTTRNKKQTELVPPPPSPPPRAPSARSTRSGSRSAQPPNQEPQPDARPKRTRTVRKKVLDSTNNNTEKKSAQSSQENLSSAVSSPGEKPRPKRTRRGRKAAENPDPPIIPNEKQITEPDISSPILQKEIKIPKATKKVKENVVMHSILQMSETKNEEITENMGKVDLALNETKLISKTVEMDETVVLPNGVYNHAPVTPTAVRIMNTTVVLERESIVTENANNNIMNTTVVLEKVTADSSLMTDDSDSLEMFTPPQVFDPEPQPSSAVKEKVQQFEELASRVTRTKTRAMVKKAEEEQTDADKPTCHPDRVEMPRAVLSTENLKKMNKLIFNGKAPQISNLAAKPRAVPLSTTRAQVPLNASKLLSRTADGDKRLEVEDPRQKKEALLEAKRELHRRKREEKMAAAAAAREAAERERLAAVNAAVKEKKDKLAQVNAGKMARLKEVEKKKQEYMRKLAVNEERRKAEEAARQQRLEDEQKRMEAQRWKQIEEQLQMKKEEAIMAKEIEKRQKEYIEKQKKQRTEEKILTPLRTPGTPRFQLEPVYMADGFQYLNSDEEEEPLLRPVPEWSTSMARKKQLEIQSALGQVHVDRLFSVRVHNPDLREIFPNIDRSRLKRTSSAVWHTPPQVPSVHK